MLDFFVTLGDSGPMTAPGTEDHITRRRDRALVLCVWAGGGGGGAGYFELTLRAVPTASVRSPMVLQPVSRGGTSPRFYTRLPPPQ